MRGEKLPTSPVEPQTTEQPSSVYPTVTAEGVVTAPQWVSCLELVFWQVD
jgi:hypothetical protein